jgi:phosphate-selective porin
VNYIDNIPITKNFENLKMEDDRETIIDFQVPPNLETIKVDFSVQVLNNISKAMQNFSASHTFTVATHKSDGTTWDFHLRVVEGKKYEIHCLGKNGEPRALNMVNVSLTHSRVGNKSTSLVSDKQGKIYLGKLDHVLSIDCRSSSDGVNRQWNIYEMSSDTWSYPGEINIIENGTVEIPVAHMWDPEKPN